MVRASALSCAKKDAERALQGVGGGAWFPSAQGALADKAYTRRSYLVPLVGFIAMAVYAMYVVAILSSIA
jgi:FHS family L-fucose permease-like MFS transporter